MSLDSDLLNRIEHPEDEALRSLFTEAQQTTRDRLAEWGYSNANEWTVRKMTYTYYYQPDMDNPNLVFLLQDPGGLQKRHTEELEAIQQLQNDFSTSELIDVYRQFAKSWLLRRNEDFSRLFFTALDDLGLISIDQSWEAYLCNEQFFDDFYMTDVVKYRTDGFTTRHEAASVEAFLLEELTVVDPDLIFAFGGNAWSAVQEHLEVRLMTDEPIDSSKITETHGHLWESVGMLETHVLPLSHMSGQIWWRFPPDEYIERMREGIQTWRQCQ